MSIKALSYVLSLLFNVSYIQCFVTRSLSASYKYYSWKKLFQSFFYLKRKNIRTITLMSAIVSVSTAVITISREKRALLHQVNYVSLVAYKKLVSFSTPLVIVFVARHFFSFAPLLTLMKFYCTRFAPLTLSLPILVPITPFMHLVAGRYIVARVCQPRYQIP